MKKIRVGLIGLGWVGCHRHVPAMMKSPYIELVGVCDRNPTKAKQIAEKFGIRSDSCTEIADISWLADVDAVSIATPPMQHYEMASNLLSLGKNVITEKPFCMDVEQGKALCNEAKKHEKKLCVVHNFQFSTAFKKMLHDIETGKIGTIRSITGIQMGNPHRRLPEWYQELPLGLFFDESPHLLYLLRRLAGGELTLANVFAVKSTTHNATPASVDAFYTGKQSGNNIPISIHMRFEHSLSEWYVMVSGDNYVGIVDLFRNIYICLKNDGKHVAKDIIRTSMDVSVQHWIQTFTQGIQHVTGRLDYGNTEVFNRFALSINNDEWDNFIGADSALAVLGMQTDIIRSVFR